MSLWSRIAHTFRVDRLNQDIDEELASHLAEAIEQGRDPSEARRALGRTVQYQQQGHDAHVVAWLESLRADLIFGWRQLRSHKITSFAAILSLALAIGACTSAFRLIDALFLRPLPVAHADSLYALARQGPDDMGVLRTFDDFAYPNFTRMRAAAKGQAELIATSFTYRTDLTYATENEMEKGYAQYVSGTMFPIFGLQPTLGRLFTADDDRTPAPAPPPSSLTTTGPAVSPMTPTSSAAASTSAAKYSRSSASARSPSPAPSQAPSPTFFSPP
jgi:hypothetical protein